MSNSVIVETNPGLGWDCIIGVFSSKQAILDSWLNFELDEPFAEFVDFQLANDDLCFFTKDVEQ